MSIATKIRRSTSSRTSRDQIEIALVNTMPDAAFEDTERQFTRLLRAGAQGRPVDIGLYSVPDPERSGVVRRLLAERYQDLGALYRRPPDAIIVTGSEPRRSDLRDEATWDSLTGLLRWAERSTSSVLLSCLAAHTALLALDGVKRERLATKVSGVYAQSLHPTHPLTDGVGTVACPHSRLHDVPVPVVEGLGYVVLAESPEVGWTVAARDGACLTVLVQGHPEYSPTTLLREYRRDIRRYLAGSLDTYPPVPVGYLEPGAVRLLESFRDAATVGEPDASLLDSFPFQNCADRIAVDWQRPMEHLFGNWLTEVRRRKENRALSLAR